VPVLLGVVLVGSALAACSGSGPARSSSPPTAPAVALPDSPVGAQARWLIAAMAHLPIADVDVSAHFDAAFLAEVSPPMLNQVLQGFPGMRLVSVEVDQPTTLVAITSVGASALHLQASLAVDAEGLISGLRFGAPPPPTTFDGVDAALRSVAPHVRLLVAAVSNGSCQPLHSIDPGTPAPLGSAFKLYVLHALAAAVASGKVSWDQPLTITAQQKSLPSGTLQNEPDGTQISVRDVAAKMISISDNTAEDMLANLVGRPAVEAALTASGMADPSRDQPFLTTRELFILRLDQWRTLADRYIAAGEADRRALLASTIDPAPLPTGPVWTTPRDIDSIEWFASAKDICGVYASLAALARQPGLSPVADVLEINDGGLELDPTEWQTTWFKGGSEPGVLTLAYLATTRTGRTYVVVALAENPSAPIDETPAELVMLSAIKGAFTLAARSAAGEALTGPGPPDAQPFEIPGA